MASKTNIFNNGPDESAMHPAGRTLLRTWERVRGEQSAPNRTDLTMRDLANILPWVCVLHRDPEQCA